MQATLKPTDRAQTGLLELHGDIVLDDAADLYATLRRLASQSEPRHLQVDFAAVETLDSAGAVAIKLGIELFAQQGRRCELVHLSDQHKNAIGLVTEARRPAKKPAARHLLQQWAARVMDPQAWVDTIEMIVDTVWSGVRCFRGRDRRRLVDAAEQTVVLGVDASPIVALLSFLIGVILAFQGAFQLRKFGASPYMAELVSLGMVREFASIITAIILAGRSGAAMAAEIGTMVVQEEVDALRAMGISTAQFLVFPRVAGITLAQPLLTIMSMAIGIGTGIGVGGLLGIPSAVSFQRMQDALEPNDFALGLIKSVLFAWIIGFVGCFMGLATRGGARSVGRHTTAAVVLSITLIVVTDSIVTTAWTMSYGATTPL